MNRANLALILEDTCHRFPERNFLSYKDVHFTFEEMDRAVCALGARLRDLKIAKGDKVALMLPNIPEFVVAYFAVLRIGAVAVTLNPASTPYEMTHLLNNSESKVLIGIPSSARKHEEIRNELLHCRHLIITGGAGETFSLAEALAARPGHLAHAELSGDDPAAIIYTSGLTGKPLGAVLTHYNLSTQSVLLRDVCEGTEHDRVLGLIPFYHSFGASVNMLMTIKVGASVVMMDKFNMEGIFTAIEDESITFIAAVPRLYLGMLLHAGADLHNLGSLRFCITGGSKMPAEYIHLFYDRFRVPLLEGYGLTEASPVCAVNHINMKNKPGSIGFPIPRVEVRIVDESGKVLRPGETGELLIRGPNVMKGYFNDKAATAEVIKEGWLFTGDLAMIDEEGYIYIMGLKKRMIITNGFNVYPREVEDILAMCPAAASSRVVGKADLMRGEIVTALVVKAENAAADEKDIIKYCRQYLSPYKCPREVMFVDALEDDASSTGAA